MKKTDPAPVLTKLTADELKQVIGGDGYGVDLGDGYAVDGGLGYAFDEASSDPLVSDIVWYTGE